MKKIPYIKYRTHGGKYVVVDKWTCKCIVDEHFKVLNIPSGFSTDGASIPRVFWWILSPFDPRYMEEATVHDYLCNKKQLKCADAWFEQLLIDNSEIKMWHRKVFITSVKDWHWVGYRDVGYFGDSQPRWWLKKVKQYF